MTQAISFDQAQEIGLEAMIQLIFQIVTHKELARMACVSPNEAESFQGGERLNHATRQRLIRAAQLVDAMSQDKPRTTPKPAFPLIF